MDNMVITGHVHCVLTDMFGNVKQDIEFPNLVVTVGKQWIASRLASNVGLMTNMAVGTSATAPALGNTALVAEVGRSTLTSTIPTGATVTYTGFFGQNVGTGTLNEAGIFDSSSGGIMLCRTLFSAPIVKAATDSLTVTWTVTVN